MFLQSDNTKTQGTEYSKKSRKIVTTIEICLIGKSKVLRGKIITPSPEQTPQIKNTKILFSCQHSFQSFVGVAKQHVYRDILEVGGGGVFLIVQNHICGRDSTVLELNIP